MSAGVQDLYDLPRTNKFGPPPLWFIFLSFQYCGLVFKLPTTLRKTALSVVGAREKKATPPWDWGASVEIDPSVGLGGADKIGSSVGLEWSEKNRPYWGGGRNNNSELRSWGRGGWEVEAWESMPSLAGVFWGYEGISLRELFEYSAPRATGRNLTSIPSQSDILWGGSFCGRDGEHTAVNDRPGVNKRVSE